MSKITHAIYLSIIFVLVSALTLVWLNGRPAETTAALPVRIAVFDFFAGNPDSEAPARSLKAELVALLENNESIELIPDSELLPYRSDNHERLSKDFGVGLIVEASVRVRGDRLRLSAQLIDGVSSAHVWAEAYESNLDNTDSFVASLYEEIQIAANLR